MLPNWMSSYLNDDQFKEIESLITTIETKTDGEVLPVIAKQSQNYKPYSLLMALISLAILMPAFAYLNQLTVISNLAFWILSISVLLISLLIFPQIMNTACFVSFLSQLTNNKDIIRQKAYLEFYANNIGKTQFKTGVLIYISLLEKQIVVLADKAINERVGPEQWAHTVTAITKGIQEKNLFQGLQNGLKECGQILEKEFPHTSIQANQLPDRLIILKEY